jgi:hypothetical protein
MPSAQRFGQTLRSTVFCALLGAFAAGAPALAVDPPKEGAPKKPDIPVAPDSDIDAPREPLVPGAPRDAKPEPARKDQIRVADSVDPRSFDIVTRAMKLAASIKSLSLVTSVRFEGEAPADLPAGFGEPNEVSLEYLGKDAVSLPRLRVSPVSSGGVVVFTYNGAEALVVDNGAKVFRSAKAGWYKIAPFALPALPQWLVAERQAAIAAGKKSSEIELRPVLVSAVPMGVEKVDGTECDVIRIVKNLDAYSDDAGHGKPGVVDARRVVLEIAYARADGFPRRVVQYGEDAPKNRAITEYSKVKVNPAFDISHFSATPPAGYSPAGDSVRAAPGKQASP